LDMRCNSRFARPRSYWATAWAQLTSDMSARA
jgi:hypothetical protein